MPPESDFSNDIDLKMGEEVDLIDGGTAIAETWDRRYTRFQGVSSRQERHADKQKSVIILAKYR